MVKDLELILAHYTLREHGPASNSRSFWQQLSKNRYCFGISFLHQGNLVMLYTPHPQKVLTYMYHLIFV